MKMRSNCGCQYSLSKTWVELIVHINPCIEIRFKFLARHIIISLQDKRTEEGITRRYSKGFLFWAWSDFGPDSDIKGGVGLDAQNIFIRSPAFTSIQEMRKVKEVQHWRRKSAHQSSEHAPELSDPPLCLSSHSNPLTFAPAQQREHQKDSFILHQTLLFSQEKKNIKMFEVLRSVIRHTAELCESDLCGSDCATAWI